MRDHRIGVTSTFGSDARPQPTTMQSSVASRGLYVCGSPPVLMDECSCVAWRVGGPRRWDLSYSDGRISERVVSSEQLLNRGPKNSGLPQNISKRKTQPMISAF